MTVWAYVPGRTFEGYVYELPATARRLDTGEIVTDVAKWANACGYWDTTSPTVASDIQQAKQLTNAEFVQLVADFTAARDRVQDRRGYVEARALEWAQAKGTLVDWSDQIPPYEIPDNGPMPTTPTGGETEVAFLRRQVLWMYGRLDPRQQYIYDQEKRLTDVLVPMGDFVFALAEALIAELEQSETFHPPGAVL